MQAEQELSEEWTLMKAGQPGVPKIEAWVADNLERLASISIAFAGFMAGRWVAAFVAARVATFSLSTALTVLRGALIRTGIGALTPARRGSPNG